LTYAALDLDSGGFNQTLLDCVEEAVRSILGEQVLESLFVRLQTYDGIRRDEIPDRLEMFFPALERAFGHVSGKTIGRFIIKVLYIRLGLKFDGRSNRVLFDYVGDARKQLGLEN
jgi:hypothetical protein